MASKRRRGRPKLDIALRTRNWVWYWMLKTKSGLSDDELDHTFLKIVEGVRPRLFFRIRAVGSSPDEMLRCGSRKTVYQLVDRKAPGRYRHAQECFRSPLWRILTERDLAIGEFTKIAAGLIEKRGWYRATKELAQLGRTFLGHHEPAFETNVGPTYSAMLHHLAASADIDSIALLSALFREAHAAFDLEKANAIQIALKAATAVFRQKNEIPEDVGALLQRLIYDRVLGNFWIEEETSGQASAAAQKPTTRIKEIRSFTRRYTSGQLEPLDSKPACLPVVERSDRLDWLEDNRGALTATASDLNSMISVHWQLEDSPSKASREKASRAQLFAKKIRKRCQPPKGDDSRCLPVSDPPILILESLPTPRLGGR